MVDNRQFVEFDPLSVEIKSNYSCLNSTILLMQLVVFSCRFSCKRKEKTNKMVNISFAVLFMNQCKNFTNVAIGKLAIGYNMCKIWVSIRNTIAK